MPEPTGAIEQVRYARQVAREALVALAPQTLVSAPVHINFPFDEPLVPAYDRAGVFELGRAASHDELPLLIEPSCALMPDQVVKLERLLEGKRARNARRVRCARLCKLGYAR